MKNNAIPFLVFLCLFWCCKKPHDPHEPGGTKKYPVNFTVSGFDQHMEELGKTTDTLTDYIGYLYYVVFQQDNGYVHKIEQVTTDDDFGTIYDSLPAGQYIIALVGSKDPVTLEDYHHEPTPNFLVMRFPGTDAFYKRLVLSVNGAVNQTVSLDRIVGKLKVIIKDRIPYDAHSIILTPSLYPPPVPDVPYGYPDAFNLRSGEMLPNGGPGDNLVYNGMYHEFTPTEKGMLDFSMEDYILMPVTDTFTVHLSAAYASGQTISSKILYNIRVSPGKRTVLSGKLFDNLPGNDSGINVIIANPEWSADSTLQNF